MIWIAISLIICTALICCTIIIFSFEKEKYLNTVYCLKELCDVLNEKFPGSNLKVIADNYRTKVEGELKYLRKDDN